MKAATRILVVTEVVADAELVKKLLQEEFNQVSVASKLERAAQDFETVKPDVLILAFDTLEKAEHYYLGLYRLSTQVHALPHQTIILCNKVDLRQVYELCKKRYFDDYVLFWPMGHDAPRLLMAVHHALRKLAGAQADLPTASQFAAQARRLGELESLLEQHAVSGGQHIDVANQSLAQAQRDIGTALDGLSQRLEQGGRGALVEVKDRAGFEREIQRLKTQEIEPRLQSVASAVQPLRQWAGALKGDLAPQLQSARALHALAERIRPLLLVVDDDDFQLKLLCRMLGDTDFEVHVASDGLEALASLRERRPDLILMDVNLGGIGGIETTRRLKASPHLANIPVIMVTGHSDKEVVVESLKAGAAGFIVKPVSREVLLAKVQALLGGGAAS